MLDLQTGKVIRSVISSEALAVFPLRKFRAEPPPPLMHLEFQTALSPMPIEFQSKKPPFSLRIPRCCPWYGMDIFLNHPIHHYPFVHLGEEKYCESSIMLKNTTQCPQPGLEPGLEPGPGPLDRQTQSNL